MAKVMLQEIPFKQKKLQSSHIMPIFALFTGIVQVGVILTLMAQSSQIEQIATRSVPTLVQTIDGRAIKVTPKDTNYREPELLDKTLRQWLYLTFTWSSRPKDGAIEPEVKVNAYSVPKNASEASFLLDESLRISFLELLGKIKAEIPKNSDVAFKIDSLSSPQEEEIGTWKSKLVGYLLVFEPGEKVGRTIAFNKVITLQAVPPPSYPLPAGDLTPLQSAVYKMQEAGVKISWMEDLSN